MTVTKIILDTDIGDDIDDALALGLICASPELQLLGVTTVFGNVLARARQARTVLKVAGDRFASIPVAAGCGASMASRPNHGTTAYLENHLPNQDSTCLPENELAPLEPRHAVNFLIDTIMSGNGDVIPITIGALTNLASAMVLERRIVAKIPRIVAMAAEFKRPFAEWNIRCDPEAAHIVFASGIPMDVITWDIGNTVMFDESHIDQLNRSPRPLASRLAAAIAAWKKSHTHNPTIMPSLFDPMAVATMIKPDLCTWKTGTVMVELQGRDTYGFTTFHESKPGEKGLHRVAWDANREASFEFYLKRILAI
jgi:purine nucleosidase/pyrimidine-specific ribonucleoside hydrolase